jgi:hypothetical protein
MYVILDQNREKRLTQRKQRNRRGHRGKNRVNILDSSEICITILIKK